MNLNDECEIRLGVAEAWAVLTAIQTITPYLPGIWLRAVEGEKYQGVVKVKVGPVTVWYEGVARYLLLDAAAHRAVLKAEGDEIYGQGNGTALVTATLSPRPPTRRIPSRRRSRTIHPAGSLRSEELSSSAVHRALRRQATILSGARS